jgi:hypothetical protein
LATRTQRLFLWWLLLWMAIQLLLTHAFSEVKTGQAIPLYSRLTVTAHLQAINKLQHEPV